MSRMETKSIGPTSGAWQLHDGERPLERVESEQELARLIRDLPISGTTPNRIVDLESPSGNTLSLGIAGINDPDNPGLREPIACVHFTQASLDPPYLTPVGDASLTYEDGGVIVFRYEGSWTEILRRNCVPVEAMIRIAEHFFRHGILPDWVSWEEV